MRQPQRAQQGSEDAELGRSAEKERFRVRQKRAEVSERPDAHEDDQGKSARLDTHKVSKVQQPVAFCDARSGDVRQDPAEPDGHEQEGLELPRNGQIQKSKADAYHHSLAPGQLVKARTLPDLGQQIHGQAKVTRGSPTATASPSRTWTSATVPS